jgi:hypothetical protein
MELSTTEIWDFETSQLRDFWTLEDFFLPFHPKPFLLEFQVFRLHNIVLRVHYDHQGTHHPCSRGGPRGEILESNTWPNQMGDTCHVLTSVLIIQRFLNHLHVEHIPCVHVFSSDVSKPYHFGTSDLDGFFTLAHSISSKH